MAATVRIFFMDGLVTAPASSTRFVSDSVGLLKWPYLGSANVTATGAASSSSAAPAKTALVHVQVQSGKAVHFELNPPNRSVAASANSPVMTGSDTFVCGENWTISVMENTE